MPDIPKKHLLTNNNIYQIFTRIISSVAKTALFILSLAFVQVLSAFQKIEFMCDFSIGGSL